MNNVAAILMDLSNAFDCLPHNILLCKLPSYGLTVNASKLMESYFSDRKSKSKLERLLAVGKKLKRSPPRFNSMPPSF